MSCVKLNEKLLVMFIVRLCYPRRQKKKDTFGRGKFFRMLPASDYTVARQTNDGDCLASSLGVIASLTGRENMVLSHPVLAGDGETMRIILSDYVADACERDAQVVDDLSWRLFVKTEMQQHWSDALEALKQAAIYENGRVVKMGTFVGDVFIKAFEAKYGATVGVFSYHLRRELILN